jgi:hypothetical protein
VNIDDIEIVYVKAALDALNENQSYALQLYDYHLAVTWLRRPVVTFYHGDLVSNSSPCVAKH